MSAKERPILFSGPMVRAILEGRKTQTRRVVKPQPPQPLENGVGISWIWWADREAFVPNGTLAGLTPAMKHGIQCKHGQPGERLWVKETWRTRREWDNRKPTDLPLDEGERADLDYARQQHITYCTADDGAVKLTGKTRPCLFMRRWMSRITLELTGVRVERLQEISAKDILAEGAVVRSHDDPHLGKSPISAFDGKLYPDLKSLWGHGWESINGKGSWALNPWCWVLSFKRL